MKFHEYRTMWEEMREQLPRHVTADQFYAASVAGGGRTGNGLVLAEGVWQRLHRPYYQLWPAIVPALLKLRLDLDASLIHTPLRALAIRLPAEKPIGGLPGVHTALMYQEDADDLRLWVNFMGPTGLFNLHMTLGCEPGKTLERSFQESAVNTQSYVVSGSFFSEQHLPMAQDCLRLCAMLCLLADDPDVITPDVLADDRPKYEESGDHKYVEKAHRRGKVGWNVGAKIEVMPHYRRPHPALVWTGHGRTLPKIVMRKGSVVHRDVLGRVPTGLADEGLV
ncbi:MAG: hypothetical protein ACLQUT_00950 [Thermoleophilia bacterium]